MSVYVLAPKTLWAAFPSFPNHSVRLKVSTAMRTYPVGARILEPLSVGALVEFSMSATTLDK